MKVPRLLLTSGESAGIGPELCVKLAQESWSAEVIVLADPALLEASAQQLKTGLKLLPYDSTKPAVATQAGELKIIPLDLAEKAEPGRLNPANAAYVIKMLEYAAKLALQKQVDALITAPVHKGLLNQAGFAFQGHTEFFAALAKIPKALMLFVVQSPLTTFCKKGELKVALATTHLPLKDVPKALNAADLKQSLRCLHQALITHFKVQKPLILVAGLNPHAGEQGYLGREEIDLIEPVLNELRQEGLSLQGPLSADTLFTEKFMKTADAVLALYHDQALPVVKTLGFGQGVNLSLGLPFIRTSVDHGTALDLAGKGQADVGSLKAALSLALRLQASH